MIEQIFGMIIATIVVSGLVLFGMSMAFFGIFAALFPVALFAAGTFWLVRWVYLTFKKDRKDGHII